MFRPVMSPYANFIARTEEPFQTVKGIGWIADHEGMNQSSSRELVPPPGVVMSGDPRSIELRYAPSTY